MWFGNEDQCCCVGNANRIGLFMLLKILITFNNGLEGERACVLHELRSLFFW